VIRSMTGYGQARWEEAGRSVVVEVRAVNSRYFRLNTRMPHEFAALETELASVVRETIARGTVELTIKVGLKGPSAARPVNTAALETYVEELQRLGARLGCQVALTPAALATLPGVLDDEELPEGQVRELAPRIIETTRRALEAMDQMRRTEGANLAREFTAHCDAIEKLLDQVEKLYPAALGAHKERLVERVRRLVEGTGIHVGEADLAREIAIQADRAAIDEELARLRSHVAQLRQALQATEPVGRRIEFIGQEMQREVNTASAKAPGDELTTLLTALQGEVDKIREQALNVE